MSVLLGCLYLFDFIFDKYICFSILTPFVFNITTTLFLFSNHNRSFEILRKHKRNLQTEIVDLNLSWAKYNCHVWANNFCRTIIKWPRSKRFDAMRDSELNGKIIDFCWWAYKTNNNKKTKRNFYPKKSAILKNQMKPRSKCKKQQVQKQ